MTIEIAGYKFAGAYSSTSSLENRSGVYAVLTPTDAMRYKVIDVGESATVKNRIETHDRKPCWQRNANNGGFFYAVHYTPRLQQAGRRLIEQEIRKKYRPSCGSQ